MSERIERIRQKLADALAPSECEIVDESHLHAGHPGALGGRGHFRLTIRSASFDGKSRIERHRLVYAALGDMMQMDIHALSVRALASAE
jgi:BolA protein